MAGSFSYKRPVLLGLGHAFNDCVAGFLLGGLLYRQLDTEQIALAVLAYNLLAFGGQVPAALLFDKKPMPRFFLCGSVALSILALILGNATAWSGIMLSGIASAFYHVAGGACCLGDRNPEKATGIFAGPGVAGLVLGGWMAYLQLGIINWLVLAGLMLVVVLLKMGCAGLDGLYQKPARHWAPDNHDIIMIVLLSAIALRSMVWNVLQLLHEQHYTWLFAFAISAMTGKLLGGALARRLGWKLWTMGSLLLAIPLLTLFKKSILALCLGIGLLQSALPVTALLMYQLMPQRPALATSYSFGLSIIMGGFIFFSPIRSGLLTDMALYIVSALILLAFIFINRRLTIPTNNSQLPTNNFQLPTIP